MKFFQQKHSFSFPTSPLVNQNGHNNNHNQNGNANNNINNSPPAESVTQNFLAPRPLRRCRSASPAGPQRQPQCQQANGAIYHHQLLSTEQQSLIRKSWLKISKATFGATIFEKMLGNIF